MRSRARDAHGKSEDRDRRDERDVSAAPRRGEVSKRDEGLETHRRRSGLPALRPLSSGNRITSRIEWLSVSNMARRSIPMPSPAVGGRPYPGLPSNRRRLGSFEIPLRPLLDLEPKPPRLVFRVIQLRNPLAISMPPNVQLETVRPLRVGGAAARQRRDLRRELVEERWLDEVLFRHRLEERCEELALLVAEESRPVHPEPTAAAKRASALPSSSARTSPRASALRELPDRLAHRQAAIRWAPVDRPPLPRGRGHRSPRRRGRRASLP